MTRFNHVDGLKCKSRVLNIITNNAFCKVCDVRNPSMSQVKRIEDKQNWLVISTAITQMDLQVFVRKIKNNSRPDAHASHDAIGSGALRKPLIRCHRTANARRYSLFWLLCYSYRHF